jgi:hypothetical protein
MKIRPVGAGLFHADGQADTTKLVVAFRNFVNVPKTRHTFLSTQVHVICITTDIDMVSLAD